MIPKIVTTTQVQRNPEILNPKDDSEYTIITKNGKTISIILSPKAFEKRLNQKLENKKKSFNLSKKLEDKINQIDHKKFQKEIRDEY